MINLLPTQYKEEIKKETSWRMFAVLGLLILLFLISFSLVLFLVKEYVFSQAETQESLREAEEKIFKESGIKDIERKTRLINEELIKLNSFYKDQPQFSVVLQELAAILPPESYFTAVNFEYISLKEGIAIDLGGFAPNWEVLSQLKENLKEESLREKNLEGIFDIYEMDFDDDNWITPEKFKIGLKINL